MIKDLYIPAIEEFYSSTNSGVINKENLYKANYKFLKFISYYEDFAKKHPNNLR
jgi:hypothetical protein